MKKMTQTQHETMMEKMAGIQNHYETMIKKMLA